MASGGCERAGADACPQTSRQQSTKRSEAGPVGGSPVVNTFERWAAGPFERNKARLVEEAFPRPVLLPLATAVSSARAKPGLVVKDVSGTKVWAAKSAENEGGQHAAQLQESSGEVARLKQTGRSEQRGSEPNQPAARRPGPQPRRRRWCHGPRDRSRARTVQSATPPQRGEPRGSKAHGRAPVRHAPLRRPHPRVP